MRSRPACCPTLGAGHMANVMLLCPPQSQTSPTTTFANTFVSTVEPNQPGSHSTISSVRPSLEASIFGRSMRQHPSAPTVVFTRSPAKLTHISFPAVARPQTGTVLPRCNTMLSLNRHAGLIAAADSTAVRTAARAAIERATPVDCFFIKLLLFVLKGHYTIFQDEHETVGCENRQYNQA